MTAGCLRLSTTLHRQDCDDWVAIFNSITGACVYIRRALGEEILAADCDRQLTYNSLLILIDRCCPASVQSSAAAADLLLNNDVFSRLDDREFLQSIKPISHIAKMYILFTTGCNLACKYCTVAYANGQTPITHTTLPIIEQSLAVFFSGGKGREKEIVLYGGEPLTQKDMVFRLLHLVPRYASGHNVRLTMITNGTLITQEIAAELAKCSVFTIVSIDGPADVHNTYRRGYRNQLTHDSVVRGYNLLRNEGVTTGISLVVGPHNLSRLSEIVDYFHDVVGVDSLGFTLGHVQPPFLDITGSNYTDCLIAGLERCCDLGLWNEQLMKKIRALSKREPIIFGCPTPSGGCMIRVLPDGQVTPCENFGLDGRFSLGNIKQIKDGRDIINHPVLKSWLGRTFQSREQCRICPGLFICGGGCPYDAWLRTGDIMEAETVSCEIAKELIKWFVKRVCRLNGSKHTNDSVWSPTEPELSDLIPASPTLPRTLFS